MDDVLTLIGQTFANDAYGVPQPTESAKEVFCKVNSVTRQEFFDGGRNGLNPELRFDVFLGDYSGETICKFHDNRYAIYRTYIVADEDYIELYAERKGGVNATESTN